MMSDCMFPHDMPLPTANKTGFGFSQVIVKTSFIFNFDVYLQVLLTRLTVSLRHGSF